jgi:hypothetical protein
MLKRVLTADIGLTAGFLLIAILVVVEARTWAFRAALFPLLTGSALLVLAALKLTLDIVGAARNDAAARAAAAPHHKTLEEQDETDEPELEDVLLTATAAQWGTAIGWSATFFLMLWVLGALLTVPLFAILYLLVASRESILVALIYAAAAWFFVYALFVRVLHIPLPQGVLLTALGLA